MLRSAKLENIAQLRRLAAVLVGRLSDQSDQSDRADGSDKEGLKAEVTANCALVLIEQATYLLNRLIERLARDFVDEGGFTERLYRVRTEARGSRKKSTRSTSPPSSTGRGAGVSGCRDRYHVIALRISAGVTPGNSLSSTSIRIASPP